MEIYADTKTHFTTDNNQRNAPCGVKVRVVGLMGFRAQLAPSTTNLALVTCPACLYRMRVVKECNAKVKAMVANFKKDAGTV